MTEEEMAAVFALRHVRARIVRIIDTRDSRGAEIADRYLGQAIVFIAQATMIGYDVRFAAVLYGEHDTESLRPRLCAALGQVRKGTDRRVTD